jgi:hypothetical protein
MMGGSCDEDVFSAGGVNKSETAKWRLVTGARPDRTAVPEQAIDAMVRRSRSACRRGSR